MDSKEFIHNIYKGENLIECENHLESYLKEKMQELIPEHFEEIKKYQAMKELQNEIFESTKEND